MQVQLYVYDLSQGQARALSPLLLGRQINGIWHTAVVAYGTEFYFGQGIQRSVPGQTLHGAPLETVEMGATQLTRDVFEEFLASIAPRFAAEKYRLLDHNCNTFSNEVCEFLVGRPIPAHISSLPADVLSTPFGAMIEPLLRQIQHQPAATAVESTARLVAGAVGSGRVGASTANVVDCRDIDHFEQLLTSRSCVIMDATSDGCPPCREIAPVFQRLVDNYNEPGFRFRLPRGQRSFALERRKNGGAVLLGVRVDVQRCPDVARRLGITATPTFCAAVRGSFRTGKVVRGADRSALESLMGAALAQAYPPHAHASQSIPTLLALDASYTHFTRTTATASVLDKLDALIQRDAPALAPSARALRPLVDAVVGNAGVYKALDALVANVPSQALFPALDLVRGLVLERAAHDGWLLARNGDSLKALIERMSGVAGEVERALQAEDAAATAALRPTLLMLLRLAANLAADPLAAHVLNAGATLPSGGPGVPALPYRSVLTSVLLLGLLSHDAQLQQLAVTGPLRNMACFESAWRDGADLGGSAEESDEVHDDWVLELLAAASQCVASLADSGLDSWDLASVRSLLESIGRLLLFGSDRVFELVEAVNLAESLERLATGNCAGDGAIAALLRELGILLIRSA